MYVADDPLYFSELISKITDFVIILFVEVDARGLADAVVLEFVSSLYQSVVCFSRAVPWFLMELV